MSVSVTVPGLNRVSVPSSVIHAVSTSLDCQRRPVRVLVTELLVEVPAVHLDMARLVEIGLAQRRRHGRDAFTRVQRDLAALAVLVTRRRAVADHEALEDDGTAADERGPSKLSLSVPATMDFSAIRELDEQPDSLTLCREARCGLSA